MLMLSWNQKIQGQSNLNPVEWAEHTTLQEENFVGI